MIRNALAGAALLAGTQPGLGAGYDQAFVDAFAAACVPGRLSYDATRGAATAAGWGEVADSDHAELAALMAKSAEMLAAEDEIDIEHVQSLYGRDVAGARHHLVVTRSVLGFEGDDDPWVMVGCHLYNFDAAAPLDPAPVTTLIGQPIGQSHEMAGALSHVWGPPCPMPRTGDTSLSFVAEGSEAAALTGFSGIALNFSTSEPDPGEDVPETYC